MEKHDVMMQELETYAAAIGKMFLSPETARDDNKIRELQETLKQARLLLDKIESLAVADPVS